jgi:phage recombination protein Bet
MNSTAQTPSVKSKTNLPALVQPERKKALQIMAENLNVDPGKLYETLKATVFQKATEEELLALVVVSNHYGLNPLLKEIYAFPSKVGGIAPIVSIDGWINMMNRQDKFDGIEFSFGENDDGGKPTSCTATIYVKGRSKPVVVTEFYDECYVESSQPWKKMPRRMLRHKALMQAARVAFGFSGIYDEDEVKEAIDVSAVVSVAQSAPRFLKPPEHKLAEQPPKPAPDPDPAQADDDQRTPFEKIADLCKSDNVSDDQVLAFAKENKLAGAKTESTMDLTTVNATKIVETWDTILPAIREIQI